MRTALRLLVALAIWLAHREIGIWLAARDPLADLIGGERIAVGVAIALLVPLRAAVWFGIAPWVVAGTLGDLERARRARRAAAA